MGELKKLLEPVANGAGRDDDPYGALERRRRRRERNKRLRAGILAMVIAIGGTVFAVQALGGGSTTPAEPGPQEATFMGIWPELTLEDATVAQAVVDAGDPADLWRLDPVAVAMHFGTEALGWRVTASRPDTVAYDGSVRVVLKTPEAVCPTPEPDARDACPAPSDTTIVLGQPLDGGGGGIWSVEEVRSESMDTDLEPGAPLPDGPIEVRTDLEGTVDAMAGFGDSSGSCMVAPLETSGSFSVAAPVSIPGSSCGDEGSYFWMMAFEDGTALPTTEAFDPFGGLDPVAVTLIPLARQTAEPSLEPSVMPEPTSEPTVDPTPTGDPGVGSTIPDVLEVTCTSEGMELASRQVRPQADGVHVAIDNQIAGRNGAFHATLLGRTDGRFDTFTKGLDEGMNKITWAFPPGAIYVNCFSGESFNAGTVGRDDLVEIEVVDQEGIWRSDQLPCTDPVPAHGFRADAGALSEMEDSAEAAIRLHVPGVLDSDEVAKAEYPESTLRDGYPEPLWMLVARDGETLGVFQVGGYEGKFGVHFGDVCPGSGIGGA